MEDNEDKSSPKDYVYQTYPSRNRFYCRGHLVTGPYRSQRRITYGFVIVPGIVYIVFVSTFLSQQISGVFFLLGVGTLIFSLILLTICSFIDPGILPRSKKLSQEERKALSNEKKISMFGRDTYLRYCDTCNHYKPPRSTHCGTCNNCIDRFDHHCTWLGNCVSGSARISLETGLAVRLKDMDQLKEGRVLAAGGGGGNSVWLEAGLPLEGWIRRAGTKRVVKITLEDGSTLVCTPEHALLGLQEGDNKLSWTSFSPSPTVPTSQLRPGHSFVLTSLVSSPILLPKLSSPSYSPNLLLFQALARVCGLCFVAWSQALGQAEMPLGQADMKQLAGDVRLLSKVFLVEEEEGVCKKIESSQQPQPQQQHHHHHHHHLVGCIPPWLSCLAFQTCTHTTWQPSLDSPIETIVSTCGIGQPPLSLPFLSCPPFLFSPSTPTCVKREFLAAYCGVMPSTSFPSPSSLSSPVSFLPPSKQIASSLLQSLLQEPFGVSLEEREEEEEEEEDNNSDNDNEGKGRKGRTGGEKILVSAACSRNAIRFLKRIGLRYNASKLSHWNLWHCWKKCIKMNSLSTLLHHRKHCRHHHSHHHQQQQQQHQSPAFSSIPCNPSSSSLSILPSPPRNNKGEKRRRKKKRRNRKSKSTTPRALSVIQRGGQEGEGKEEEEGLQDTTTSHQSFTNFARTMKRRTALPMQSSLQSSLPRCLAPIGEFSEGILSVLGLGPSLSGLPPTIPQGTFTAPAYHHSPLPSESLALLRVVKVQPLPHPLPVFDLVVPNPSGHDMASFVANGVVCHNCVGKRNYHMFFLFVTLTVANLGMLIFTSVFHIVLASKLRGWKAFIATYPENIFPPIFLIFFASLLIIPVTLLWLFHIMLVARNITTNEFLKNMYRKDGSPFSQGIVLNCLYFLLPTRWPNFIAFHERNPPQQV